MELDQSEAANQRVRRSFRRDLRRTLSPSDLSVQGTCWSPRFEGPTWRRARVSLLSSALACPAAAVAGAAGARGRGPTREAGVAPNALPRFRVCMARQGDRAGLRV